MSSNDDPIQRWDPLVTPTSSKWTNQVSVFKLLLAPSSTETLDSILSDYFTPSERELALPATSPPYLVELQADRTARYRRLLAGRFRGVEDNTVTRLTMLYFGLPAEPIMSDMFRALDADVEMLDGADVRTYEVRPPLHFLTAYDHRHYGRDELRGSEAPLSYIPVTQSHATALKLGREIEGSEEPAPCSSLRGGGEPENMDSSGYIDDTTMAPVPPPGLQFMCGFQGRIGFRAEMNGGVIERTIRRLLGIAKHEKDAQPRHRIVVTHLDVGRLNGNVGPNGDTNPILRSWTDDYPVDPSRIMMHMVAHGKTTSDHSNCCMWFVHYENEDPPATWRPSPEERKRMITLAREDAPDELAYFMLPEFVGTTFLKDTGKNMYSAYMRTAMEVLLGRMNKPGDNHCSVLVYDREEKPSKDDQWCYSGLELPQKVYEKLYPSIGRATPWAVKVSPFDPEAIALCFAGYEQVPRTNGNIRGNFQVVPSGDEADAWKCVYEMVDGYLSEDMKKRPLTVGLEPTYDLFEAGPVDGEILGPHHLDYVHADCKGPQGPRAWTDGLAKYLRKGSKMGHRAYNTVVGLREQYKLIPKWAKNITPEACDDVAVTFDPNKIRSLRRAIQDLLKENPDPNTDPTDLSLYITLESVSMSGSCPAAKAVITPRTTMVDFTRAVTQLMGSKFLVSLSGGKDLDFAKAVQETAIPWGPRYGDVAVFAYNAPEDYDSDNDSDTSIGEDTQPKFEARTKKKEPSPGATSGGSAPVLEGEQPPPASLQQPSVFDNGSSPSIPTGDPPKEPFLRPGGPGVPMVTKRVQTPTEQQRAIDAFYSVRNKRLGRAITCNYKGCSFTVRADDAEGMQRHLRADHVATRCPWCTSELFAYMSQADKEKHIAEQHGDKVRTIAQEYPGQVYGRRARCKGHKNISKETRELIDMANRRLDVSRPQPRLDARIPRAPERASRQEVVYKFCDRCGRDHRQFADDERDRHDKICVPRAPHGRDTSWCESCGAKVWRTRELSRQQEGHHVEWPHSCDLEAGDPHGPFCGKCGYPLGDLKDSNNTHAQNCKGFSGKMAQFCPYCGVPMGYIRDHRLREKHIITCPDQEDTGADLTSAEGTPYAMYPACMANEPGPRPEDDHFYSGWREDLRPGTWAPIGGDPARTIPRDTVAGLARAQEEAKERAEARKRAEEALAEPKGGRTRGAARAATESEEDEAEEREVEEVEVEETPTKKTAKKRPAKAAKAPARKRQKAFSQTEKEPTPPAAETTRPAEEPTAPEMETPQATEEPAAPATKPSQPENVSASPGQQPNQPSEEPDESAPEPALPSRRGGLRRKRLPSTRPDDATPSSPKKRKVAKQESDEGKQPVPPAPAPAEGDEDPNFFPEKGMWCSRCFRKVPSGKVKTRSCDPTYEEQIERHMDPNGSCRIRRARGKICAQGITFGQGVPPAGIGLPNQSGWMHDDDLGRVKLGKVRDAFIKQYPRYANTMYPQGSTTTLSVWKSDPNNVEAFPDSIKTSKALPLPMPPDGNTIAVLTQDDEDPPSGSGDRKGQRALRGDKKDKAKPKKESPNKTNHKNKDKTYRDSGGEESQDEEPEPDAVQNDHPQPETGRKKRRRNAARAGPATTAEPPTTDGPSTTADPSTTPSTAAAAENGGATQGTGSSGRFKIIVKQRTGGQAGSATEEPAADREERDEGEEGEPKRKKTKMSA